VTDRELDKNAARRLAIIRHAREVTGNVALTCRYDGISRQVFYRWLHRYEAEGLAGLRDRSRRPQHCPHETPSAVVAKIIYLRRNYHFGRRRSPCTSSVTTMWRSATPGCGESSSGWTCVPAAGLPALPAPRPQVETLRKADARPRRPGSDQLTSRPTRCPAEPTRLRRTPSYAHGAPENQEIIGAGMVNLCIPGDPNALSITSAESAIWPRQLSADSVAG
jgi:transposase-like protein